MLRPSLRSVLKSVLFLLTTLDEGEEEGGGVLEGLLWLWLWLWLLLSMEDDEDDDDWV